MMDEASRIALASVVRAYIAAHERFLRASRAYFGNGALEEPAREEWRRAMEETVAASARLRELEEALAQHQAEVREYVRTLLAPVAAEG